MYGAIIGDIAGSAYEWHSVKNKEFELFPENARFTDDTVMTVAIAESLLGLLAGGGEYSPSWRGYQNWPDVDRSGANMTDEQIRYAFAYGMRKWGRRYPDAGYGRKFFSWVMTPHAKPYNSIGNGSAMRVSPVGWLFDDLYTTRRFARLTAEVTHNHPEGIKGAESVAAAIFMARNGENKCSIKHYIQSEFGYDLERFLDEIRPIYEFDVTCQGSVPEAIIAFLEGEDYEDTIRNAISLGGDADTQAAIAGSIAEAYYGSVPSELVSVVHEERGALKGPAGRARKEGEAILPQDITGVIDTFYYALAGFQEGFTYTKKMDAESEGYVPLGRIG